MKQEITLTIIGAISLVLIGIFWSGICDKVWSSSQKAKTVEEAVKQIAESNRLLTEQSVRQEVYQEQADKTHSMLVELIKAVKDE